MEILVRADRRVPLREELVSLVGSEVLAGLGECVSRVSSVHVHLFADGSAASRAGALLCRLEVRPHGHATLAVTHGACSHDDAVRRAVRDMRDVLERIFRRIDARTADETMRRPGVSGRSTGGVSWTSRSGPTTTWTATKG